jgi:hypothetical protein
MIKSDEWSAIQIKVQKIEHFSPAYLLDESDFSTGTVDYSQHWSLHGAPVADNLRKSQRGMQQETKWKASSLHGNEKQDTLGEK